MTDKLFRVAFLLALLSVVAAASPAFAQSATGNARDDQRPTTTTGRNRSGADATHTRTTADETFELDIAERRITEGDFQASTSVETGDETARGLRLRVGVALAASNIDVLLRRVRGRVRFRASLEPLLQRLKVRRLAAPTSTTPPAPPTGERSP